MVFDYGDYDLTTPSLEDDKKINIDIWKKESRKDPFSSCRSGFEIRTYRLCQRVLMFHTFPDLNAGMPTLVHSLDFDHLPSEKVKEKSGCFC